VSEGVGLPHVVSVCDVSGHGGGEGAATVSAEGGVMCKHADDLRVELEHAAERYPSDAQAAKAFGVSRSHFSRVLRGEIAMSRAIAHCLGYELQTHFVRYEERR
jgi:AraC-like DNA-binding protein